jgi:transposase
MKAYSHDLRLPVLCAVDQGQSRAEIVVVFGRSPVTIKRYLKQRRETGELRTKPIPGRPAKKGAVLQARHREQLAALSDVTLEQHCFLWEREQGMQVSSATIAVLFTDWAGREKRRLWARANGAKRRGLPRGLRSYGSVLRNCRANITLLASLFLQGMGEALIIYIEQVLLPSLSPGQIVVIDNVSTHTGEKVRQAIEAKGCRLLLQPSNSPDLSPREKAFSKLKTFWRRAEARGWFRHCGYVIKNGQDHPAAEPHTV